MERSLRAILRAEVGGYVGPMQEAAKATEQVGRAAEQASQTTERSTSRQSRAARSFSQRLSQHAKENEQAWRNVGTAMTVTAGAVTAVGVASANVGIQYNSLRQTATQALTAVTGSTREAVEQMRRLDEYGSTSWLMRDSLIRAQQQMTGFGIETSKVIPYMDALAEGVAAAGGTSQDFEELARIMGQVNSQGKFTAETFNQFGIRGIDAAKMIADAMGTTAGRVREDITAGAIDAGDALDALAQGLVMNFEGSSDLVRNTFQGAVDDVSAAWRDLWAIITTPLVDPEGGGLLVDLLGGLSDLLFWLRDLPDPLLQVVGLLGALGTAAVGAGGAFLLLYPRVMETWNHLGNMGRVGRRAQDAIRGIGPAAGRAAVSMGKFAAAAGMAYGALVGGQRIAGAIAGFNDTAVSVDLLTSRFNALGDEMSGYDAILADLDLGSAKFQDLQSTVENLADLSGLDRFLHNMGLAADRSHVAAEGLEQAGVALRMMAEEDFAAATDAFRDLAMEAGGTDQAALDLLETMPAFRDHLEAMALDAGLAGEEFEILRLAMGHLPPEVEAATAATSEFEGALADLAEGQARANEEYHEWIDAMGQAAASFGGVVDGYNAIAEAADSGTASMSEWIEQMREQREAVEAWRENTLEASEQIRNDLPEDMQVAGEAFVNEMVLAGEEGAQALQTFVDGTPEQRRQLIEEWQGTGWDVGVLFAQELTSAPDGEVGADMFPAEEALGAFLGAVANSEEFVIVNGNPVPAENVLAAVRNLILTTEEPVSIDGNDAPANEVLDALMTAIRNEEEDVVINGNRVPADQVVTELMSWVRRQQASVKVDADTSEAMTRLGALDRTLNSIDGRQVRASVMIAQGMDAAVASGGYMGDFLAGGGRPRKRYTMGGEVFGPGTPTSDDVPAMLSRKEFVQRAAAVDYYGVDTMYALNAMRIPRENLRMALTGYRDGGSPSVRPGPSRSVAVLPPPPTPRAGVTYEVHLHGIPADQPDAFASAALFEMRRFENDSAYVRTVT